MKLSKINKQHTNHIKPWSKDWSSGSEMLNAHNE
jgi:hypothetical protein